MAGNLIFGLFLTLYRHFESIMSLFVLSGFSSRGGVLIIMHGRNRMTIDPRVPTMRKGARRVFTDQADIACTEREAP